MNCIVIASVYSLFLTVRAQQRSNGHQEAVLMPPFTFSYYSNENGDNYLNIIGKFKNLSSDMDYTIYETGESFKQKENITNKIEIKNTTEQAFRMINHKIKHEFIFITIYVTIKTNDGCSKNVTIIKGRALYSFTEKTEPGYEKKNDCLKSEPCIIEVDVLHECTGMRSTQRTLTCQRTTKAATGTTIDMFNSRGTTETLHNVSSGDVEGAHHQPTPDSNVLTYVIPSVIVVCGVILMIYIGVKKYCRQHSQPPETLEMNATAPDLVYADLNWMHGESHSPRDDEESTYAQIIGVLAPVDKNVRSK